MNKIDLDPLRAVAARAVVGVSLGGVRAAETVGPVTVASPFRIASLTKPFTAIAALKAAAGAGLHLDGAVLDVLPQLKVDWVADPGLSWADVLSQTSGLAPTVTGTDIAELGNGDEAFIEAARLVVRAGNARPPGERWEYYNGNYFIAGAAVASVVGTTYDRAMETLLLRPWGLRRTSFEAPANLTPGNERGKQASASTYPRGRRPSGGLISTLEDLLTFGERLLNEPGLLSAVRTVHTRDEDSMRYALGWAIGPSGQMYLNGRLPGYRAALMMLPTQDLVGAVLAADSESLPAVARVLSDLQYEFTGDNLADSVEAFAA